MRNGISTDRLVKDMHLVARDAEELLKATAGEASEQMKAAQSRLVSTLATAEQNAIALQERAVTATSSVVREHPLETLGAAFGVGVLIGILVNRGASRS